jgi:glycosyltransferase involved in cell wall biosynthesis
MPSKILYLSPTSQMGGGEQSLLGIITAIDKTRFQPVVLCPDEGPLVNKLREYKIEVIILPIPRLRRLNFILNFKTLYQLISIIKKDKIVLVHGNGTRENLVGGLAGKINDIPVVWHCRNLIVPGMVDWERHFYQLPSVIIANSQAVSLRFLFKGRIPAKVKVIYNGVDVNTFSPNVDGKIIRDELEISSDEILIGMVGRIGEGKGHKYFLEAAQKLTEFCKNCRFMVVGDTIFNEKLLTKNNFVKYCEKLGISSHVIFTGHRSDIPHIMASLDVLTLATEAEPFGRVLIEAMAAGKPVIATNAGGVPEIVLDGQTGILVPPRDSHALAAAMLTLVRDSKLRRKMGECGRKRAEINFSNKTMIEKVEQLYSQLISKEI